MLRLSDTMLRYLSMIAVVIPATGCEREASRRTAQGQPPELRTSAAQPAREDGFTLSLRAAAGGVAAEEVMLRVSGPYLVQARVRGRQADYVIRGPDGKTLPLGDCRRFYLGRWEYLEDCVVEVSSPGSVLVELSASRRADAGMEVSVRPLRGYHCNLVIEKNPVLVGEEVGVVGFFSKDSVQSAIDQVSSIRALVTQPDGKTIHFDLLDDGLGADSSAEDGKFARKIRATMSGPHVIELTGQAVAGGKSVVRQARGVLVVRSAGGPRFDTRIEATPEDLDQDGLAEAIRLVFDVCYPRGAQVEIRACVVGRDGCVVDPEVRTAGYNGGRDGTHPLDTALPADAFVCAECEGPFVLTDIRMWDTKAERLVDLLPDAHLPAVSLSALKKPDSPVITGIESKDAGALWIRGARFGCANQVLIHGKPVGFKIVERHAWVNIIEVAKPAGFPSAEWQEIRNELPNLPVVVKTPWAEAVWPR